MNLRVKKFIPENIKDHRITFIIGKRGTGKTVLLKDLLSKYPPVDFVIGMTPTEETADVFREFMPESCIYHEFNQQKLEQMLSVQRDLIRKRKTRNFLLILDDCMYQKGVLKSTAMRDLVMNGRHLHIAMIVCVQYLMDCGPDIRGNVDYCFALRENIISNRMKMWKFFFGMFSKYEEYAKAMDACTNDFSAMVMDNTSKCTTVEDTVFWYKASTDLEPFRLGRNCYWNMDKKCLLSEEEILKEAILQQSQPDKNVSKITSVQTTDQNGKPIIDTKALML